MKKYVFGAVLSIGLLVSPAFTQASGLTTVQINAILSLLSSFGADQSVINNVQASLSGGAPTTGGQSFCHNFNSDLTVGNSGDDVTALNQALSLSGIDTRSSSSSFNENNAGDVVAFQSHYGIRQTGYVGPMTRAKLNSLYGCHNDQQSMTWPTAPTMITPPYMNGGVTYTAPAVTPQPVPTTVTSSVPTIILFTNKDPNPTNGATEIIWQTSGPANVALDMSCTSGSISFTTDKGNNPNCTKGGVWYSQGQQSNGYILITPSGNTNSVTVPFTLTVLDSNGNYTNQKQTINITFPAALPPSVVGTFSYQQQYSTGSTGSSQMLSTYSYQIQNYRSGLVLDVEPIVNCNDSGIAPLKRDCSQYWFNLSGKAAENYTNVQGDPYVKGGALYRFTGNGGGISANGFANPSYTPPSGYINPIPDNIDFVFTLRDLNQGGASLWSQTYRAPFKG